MDDNNTILNIIEYIRKENNELWLELYKIAGVMSSSEIADIKAKREKNNTQLINTLKIICENNMEDGRKILFAILHNDRKINALFESLLQKEV